MTWQRVFHALIALIILVGCASGFVADAQVWFAFVVANSAMLLGAFWIWLVKL